MIADASPKGAFFDSTTVKMTTKSVKDGDESLKKTTVTASVSNGDGGAAGAEEKAFVLKASSMKRESDRVLEIDDDVALTFPQRLMEILDNEEYSGMISWLPHGRGFVVFRKNAFETTVLPKHFNKQSKFSSFTRKLNRWGFVRVTRGHEVGAYYHPLFQRNGHRLCIQMSCQSSNKNSAVTKSVVAPDFSGPPAVPNSLYGAKAAMPSVMSPLEGLQQTAVAEQLALQQSRQMVQMQVQRQQLVEQELLRRAALGIGGPGNLMLQQQQQGLGMDNMSLGSMAGAPLSPTMLAQLSRARAAGTGNASLNPNAFFLNNPSLR